MDYKEPVLFDKGGDLSKRWYVGYYYRNPESGKYELFQLWISLKNRTVTARKKQARELIEEYTERLQEGWSPFNAHKLDTPLIQALDNYLKVLEPFVRKRTLQTKRSHCRHIKRWLEETSRVPLISRHFSKDLAQAFLQEVSARSNWSNTTYNKSVEHFRSIFSYLKDLGYTTHNPFKKVRKVPVFKRSVRTWDDQEVERVKEVVQREDPGLWIVIILIYYTAIRPWEISNLRVCDIDFDRKLIFTDSTWSKTRKDDLVHVPDPVINELKRQGIDKLPGKYYVVGKNLKPGTEKEHSVRFSDRFRELRPKIGTERKMYELKHTSARRLLEGGASLYDLQFHFRHSNIATTAIYAQAFSPRVSKEFKEGFKEM